MIKIHRKPLSINEAYQGRRFRTPKYDLFKRDMNFLLPSDYKVPPPPYAIYFEFGLSSMSGDWDNCIKTIQDCISDKYGFNDKLIKRGIVDVVNVSKGHEYISFKIETLLK